MKIDWDRLVIVAAMHGEKYIGFLPREVEDPDEWMRELGRTNQPVLLHHVRTILSQPQVQKLPNGQQVIAGLVAVLPFEFNPGPAEELWVRASSWHFPIVNEKSQEKIMRLLEKAEESEVQIAELERQANLVEDATRAGLIVPRGTGQMSKPGH